MDYSELRSSSARRLRRALSRDGFERRQQVGRHPCYAHPEGRRFTLPFTREGDLLGIDTLRRIIENQARWNDDDLK